MGKNKNKKKNPTAGQNKSENEPKVMELSSDEEEEVKPKVTEVKEKAAKGNSVLFLLTVGNLIQVKVIFIRLAIIIIF